MPPTIVPPPISTPAPSRVVGDRITGEAECAQGVEARQNLPNVHSSNA